MKRILAYIISGCWHRWKVIDQQTVDYKHDFGSGTATRYIMQCEHCGNIKTKLAK